ncbi:MAG TPA: M23 family metallopeptidase [Saprospiraceae bacterium]|nr:M23 family metallopeptidase [Saprospiraceae bacterium]
MSQDCFPRSRLVICFLLGTTISIAQPDFQLSTNVYRMPFAAGHQVHISQDHITHDPPGRYDMDGTEFGDICNYYQIVAAAGGIVRYVVDDNDTSCTSCGAFNNYVWIEHVNGEWSKYTHFSQNSVSQAGISVGDTICAGTFLGFECHVGATSPAYNEHLHFELRLPNNPSNPPIDPAGGFLDPADGAHLIPVINSIGKHWWEQGDDITVSGSNSCTHSNINAGTQTIGNDGVKIYMASGNIHTNSNTVVFQNGSNGLFHAGDEILLTPNFHAQAGTSFSARIGNCAATQFPGCN